MLDLIDKKIEELNGCLIHGFHVNIKPRLGTFKFEFNEIIIKDFEDRFPSGVVTHDDEVPENYFLYQYLMEYRERLVSQRDRIIKHLETL